MLIALVDDNQRDILVASELVTRCLSKNGYIISKIDTFMSSASFLETFEEKKYDLILLDIFIDKMTGLDVARAIRKIDSKVKLAFITTSNDFAIDSYDVNASYYIKKPLTEKSMDKLIARIGVDKLEASRFIELPDGQKIFPRDIIFSEYFNHNITIHMRDGKDVSTWLAHNKLCELIKPFTYLLACNQGCIVNLYEVKQKDEDCFVMQNGEIITISRRKTKEINDLYEQYLFSMIREEENKVIED